MKPIISANVRIRHPDLFQVGEDSIVDDFCYFSTQVRIGKCSHVASNCTIAGGREHRFVLGDYSSLSAGVRIWCVSDDFVRDVVTVIPAGVPDPKQHLISGDVIFENYTAVGANSVVMPNVRLREGAVIGALSFVPPGADLEPWSVYAGVPVRLIRARDRDSVVSQARRLTADLARRKAE